MSTDEPENPESKYLPDTHIKPWKPGKARCIAKVKNPNNPRHGQQCAHVPTVGATVCRYHGGAAPQVIKAGKARRAKEDAAKKLAKLGQPIEGLDPTDVLLGLVWEAAGNVAFLRRKVQQLQQGWVGRVYSETLPDAKGDDDDPGEPGDGIVGPTHLGDGGAHIYLQLYAEWCEKLAKFSKMAIEAGIVERQVRIAEQQAELMAQVIRGVLRDLNIPSSPQVLAIVGRHLALAAGEPTEPEQGAA